MYFYLSKQEADEILLRQTVDIAALNAGRIATVGSNPKQIYSVSEGSAEVELGYDPIPVCAPHFIYFKFEGLRPNTQHFFFCDSVNVTNYVNTSPTTIATFGSGSFSQMATGVGFMPGDRFINSTGFPSAYGGPTGNLISDADGALEGIFYLQRNSTLSFETGQLTINVCDLSSNNYDEAVSYASTTFTVSGTISYKYTDQFQISTLVANPNYKPPVTKKSSSSGSKNSWNNDYNYRDDSCFVAGSIVTMADGSEKKIEDIVIGDILKGHTQNNVVLDYDSPMLDNPGRDPVLYSINGSIPFVTPEHPFLTTNGWKSPEPDKTYERKPEIRHLNTSQLEIGDEILMVDGSVTVVESLVKHENQPQQQVFNFKLDGDNTYYVNGMLVHNRGAEPSVGIGPAQPGMGPAEGGYYDCFVPEAMVTMADGTKKQIKDVVVGDKVMRSDGGSNTVTKTLIREKGPESKIHGFNGIKPFVTSLHPILTADGWSAFNPELYKQQYPECYADVSSLNESGEIHKIEEGTAIVFADKTEAIYDLTIREEPQGFQVYNLMLDGDHTFIVEDVVVHNKGGGGGGDKVICTALYHMGMLSDDIYKLDAQFGMKVNREDPELGDGYRLWATPIAEYIKGNGIGSKIALSIVAPLAKAWAQEMAHIMKPEEYKSNMMGKALMIIGHPISRAIGKAIKFKVKEV